jgi:uncharacterized protein
MQEMLAKKFGDKMKDFLIKILITFVALALGFFLEAHVISAELVVPKIAPYVNDFAGVLSDQQEADLNLMCDAIEKNTTYEIAIVTVQDTQGMDRIEFANKIGDENGVGKKGQDNGIVVLWSMSNEKGGAIATGRFAESILNDAKVGQIGRVNRPYFDKGDYYNGFKQIILAIETEIKAETAAQPNIIASQKEDSSAVFAILIIFGVIMILVGIFNSPFDFILLGTASSILSSSGRSSGSSGSSGGGFSGGSFGGGSFGGGGGRF